MGLVDGTVGLVTGAGSGIGRASALRFSIEGASVIVADIDERAGTETVRSIEAKGGAAAFVRCDVTDEAEVEALVATTVAQFGRLDWAHNNAGAPAPENVPVAEQDLGWWRAVLELDLIAVVACMKHEIRQYLAQGAGGAIVNTSSLAGLTGQPNLSAYVAAKWGVNGLTKSAALEYAKDMIRVNAICPGTTNTEGFAAWREQATEQAATVEAGIPMKRVAMPDEQAQAAVWLCSSRASYITGTLLTVTGGCDW